MFGAGIVELLADGKWSEVWQPDQYKSTTYCAGITRQVSLM